MAGDSTAERFDQLASTTLNVYASKTLQDQIFNDEPLLKLLQAKGRKENYATGGRYIEVPLMTGKNNTGMSYDGLEVLDTSTSEGIGNAIFPWRFYNIAITVAEGDLLKNKGDAQIIDLLKAKILQAEMSIKDDLGIMLYGDGTGNSNKDLLGLKALVGATGTLAGIDSATYDYWQSVVDSTAVAVDASWMRTMVNNVRGSGSSVSAGAGVGKVDIILTTQALYEAYEAKLEPSLRNADTKLGDLGFDALKFKGAEMTWSDNCPTGYMYFLSTSYMALKCHPDRDFKSTPFQTPINQDGRVAHIRFMGNLVTSNRRRLGVATAKTA